MTALLLILFSSFVQSASPARATDLLSTEGVWMIAMNTPEAIELEGRKGCPEAEFISEGPLLIFIQLRNACPVSGSGLINNYTVDLRNGQIWTGIDNKKVIDSERLRRLRALLLHR